MEFERSLCLEELIADIAFVWLLGRVGVLNDWIALVYTINRSLAQFSLTMCFCRFDDIVNALSHKLQTKGFSPVCDRV